MNSATAMLRAGLSWPAITAAWMIPALTWIPVGFWISSTLPSGVLGCAAALGLGWAAYMFGIAPWAAYLAPRLDRRFRRAPR